MASLVHNRRSNRCLPAFGFALLLSTAQLVAGEIEIYVTPYFNSEGPIVDVGKFSPGLASSDVPTLVATIRRMEAELASLRAEEMYVAAIRLFQVGLKPESIKWFYRAQLRSRLLQALVDEKKLGRIGTPAFEIAAANNAFFELAGPHINGFAFCSLELIAGPVAAVLEESRAMPDLKAIYPEVAFVPRSKWEKRASEVTTGLRSYLDEIESSFEEITAERDESGVTADFCQSRDT